jgi:glycosyltransferase involved in cell wall biosynthesis
VVTFRRGSTPEIIETGVSGFLVNDEVEMVDAVRRAGKLTARGCREHVRRRLNMDRVAEQYAAVYRSALAHDTAVGSGST